MAGKSAPSKEPKSVWGLPKDWDGHETRQHPFFVTSVAEIPREGWDYMFKSTNTGWAIIPYRSQHAVNDQ